MVGAGLAGASGGEATAGGGGARDTVGAGAVAGSGDTAPGLGARVSVSVPLRLPNT
jgi:hypothetical protein